MKAAALTIRIRRRYTFYILYIHRAGNPGMECGPLFMTLHYMQGTGCFKQFGRIFPHCSVRFTDSRTLTVQILPERELDPIIV